LKTYNVYSLVSILSETSSTSKFYLNETENMVTTTTTGKEAESSKVGGVKGEVTGGSSQSNKGSEINEKKKKCRPDGTLEYIVSQQ